MTKGFVDLLKIDYVLFKRNYFWQIINPQALELFKVFQTYDQENKMKLSKERRLGFQKVLLENSKNGLFYSLIYTFPMKNLALEEEILKKLEGQSSINDLNEIRAIIKKLNTYCLKKSMIDYSMQINENKIQTFVEIRINEVLTVEYGPNST